MALATNAYNKTEVDRKRNGRRPGAAGPPGKLAVKPSFLVARALVVPQAVAQPRGSGDRAADGSSDRSRSRRAVDGRPGDQMCPRVARPASCAAACWSSESPPVFAALRRPLESAQYTSVEFRQLLEANAIDQSPVLAPPVLGQRRGRSLVRTLKLELIDRQSWVTRTQVRRVVFESQGSSGRIIRLSGERGQPTWMCIRLRSELPRRR
jgi:hypothetical protein